jgi:hypothetical protein
MLRNHVIALVPFAEPPRNFIHIVRDPKLAEEAEDEFIDESLPHITLPVTLPLPTLGNLDLIDNLVHQCAMSPAGRESLVSFIHDERYLHKLVEVFHECEDMEDLDGLHHLSSIMKALSSALSNSPS